MQPVSKFKLNGFGGSRKVHFQNASAGEFEIVEAQQIYFR